MQLYFQVPSSKFLVLRRLRRLILVPFATHCPTTWRAPNGEVVPTPTLPEEFNDNVCDPPVTRAIPSDPNLYNPELVSFPNVIPGAEADPSAKDETPVTDRVEDKDKVEAVTVVAFSPARFDNPVTFNPPLNTPSPVAVKDDPTPKFPVKLPVPTTDSL